MTDFSAPSPEQVSYVRILQKKLHLPNALLDNHCLSIWHKPFADLNKRDVSNLLDQLIGWDASLPPDLMRAKGQVDLPGFGS